MDAISAISKLSGQASGLIHVGAHFAEEMEVYERAQLSPIIYIDALPDFEEKVGTLLANKPNSIAITAFCGETDGQQVDFNVSSNAGASSSALDFGRHRDEHPEVQWIERISLTSEKLDTLLERCTANHPKIDFGKIDTLVLDVQGSELNVLKGSTNLLKKVKWVFAEVNIGDLYKGDAALEEIQAYLLDFGFRLCQLEMNSHLWGDALFVKNPKGRSSPLIIEQGRSISEDLILGLETAKSTSDPDALEISRGIADLYEKIGQLSAAQGLPQYAHYGFEAASQIDLGDPALQNGWGGPLNGQEGRRSIFIELFEKLKPSAVFETGTYRGISTEWFAQNYSGQIYSCDNNQRYLLQAQKKLATYRNVWLELQDSREFVRKHLTLLSADETAVFYLDAHWLEDLPLLGELQLIIASAKKAVIVIDDFEVPFDPGYTFDDYGEGKRLCLALISKVRTEGIKIYFPKLPSTLETGARRGCCVIATEGVTGMENIDTLKKLDYREWRISQLEDELRTKNETSSSHNYLLQQIHILSEEVDRLRETLSSRDDHIHAVEKILAERDLYITSIEKRVT